MTRRPFSNHQLAFVSVLLAACSAKPSDSSSAQSKPDRATRCDRIADQMARLTEGLGAGLASALGEDEGDPEESKQSLAEAAEQVRRDLYNRCLDWPEEALGCFEGLGGLDPKCERIVAEAMGQPVEPENVATGPKPAWTHGFPNELELVRIAKDGSVLAMFEDEGEDGEGTGVLVRVRGGKQLWRFEGELAAWAVEVGELLVLGSDKDIVGVDAGDGRERFRVTLPAFNSSSGESKPIEKIPEDDQWEWDSAWVRLAAAHGDGVLVADSVGRFWRLDLAACEASRKDCLTREGMLADEDFDEDDQLFVLPDGSRVLVEHENLRVFDSEWKTKVDIRAHDSIGFAAGFEDVLVALVDDDLMVLEPARCFAEQPFAPSSYPQPGRLYIAGDDECSDCGPVPAGCVRWRHYVSEAHAEPFAVVSGPLAVVNGEDGTFGVADGSVRWQHAFGGGGPTAALGQAVFAVGMGDDEGEPISLWKLDAGGAVAWKSTLPFTDEGWIYSTDDVHLSVAPGWVLAGYEKQIAVFGLSD